MRVIFISLFFLCFTIYSFSQTTIYGWVKDSIAHEPLPFCSIALKNSQKGTISNSEGEFSISVDLIKDTILFTFLGYHAKAIPATDFLQNKTVLLRSKEIVLQSITIIADNDLLYESLEKCSRKLQKNRTQHSAKVYFGIETQSNAQPIELVECYYSGYLKGETVDHLLFKNGRFGQAEIENHYFLTLNSSKAISSLELTDKNDNYPATPFQYGKKEIKKNFILSTGYSDDNMQSIRFRPRHEEKDCFSGEVWIDPETNLPLKINLNIKNASKHPFLPLFSLDSLYNVSLDISQTYKQEGIDVLLDHINFSYSVTYRSKRDSTLAKIPHLITSSISTKGIMYFYDYENPFILPYFEYNNTFDDYRKMSVIPYNEVFWSNNNPLLLTGKQKENLGFFASEGHLLNYKNGNYGKDFMKVSSFDSCFYENYYSFWSPDKRVMLSKKMLQNKTYSKERINQSIQSDLYNLKVQILLDITQLTDSLNCKSFTVFDAAKTFYHLPENNSTSAFLNIYFDICEIERRKMEILLNAKNYSITEIDSIYLLSIKSMNSITQRYIKEVKKGENEKSFHAWNRYVRENLQIDNIKMLQIKED